MIAKLLLVTCAAGCVTPIDDGGAWTPIAMVEGALAAEVGPTMGALRADACTLRVVTWNVHLGEDTAGLANTLRESDKLKDADVLMIQEIESWPTEPSTRSSRMAEALGMTWVYTPARIEDAGTHGLSFMSRYPLESSQIRELPYFDQILRPRHRIAASTEVVVGTRRVQLINVHLDLRLGPIDRIRQLAPAVQDVADRVVIGGDFNTNPFAWGAVIPLTATQAVVGQSQADVIDDYMVNSQGFTSAIEAGTSTVRFPGYEIRTDDVYTRGIAIRDAGVEQVGDSDHWPIWVDIDLCN